MFLVGTFREVRVPGRGEATLSQYTRRSFMKQTNKQIDTTPTLSQYTHRSFMKQTNKQIDTTPTLS